MLGTDVCGLLGDRGISYSGVDEMDFDLLDVEAVRSAVRGHAVVVNCAAWTAVDTAEEQEGLAFGINAVAAAMLARAARENGARLLQVSTDYVFDGRSDSPYPEDETPAPRSAYGRTKAAGEWAVRAEAPDRATILRTAWLYGRHGRCFPRTIARVTREQGTASVVDDQHGQPTWTRDVADLMIRLVEADAPAGIWHATSSGQTSWFGFAQAVVEAAGLGADVVNPTDSTAVAGSAPRPAFSVLGHDRLHAHGFEPIGDWRERWNVAASEVLALHEAE